MQPSIREGTRSKEKFANTLAMQTSTYTSNEVKWEFQTSAPRGGEVELISEVRGKKYHGAFTREEFSDEGEKWVRSVQLFVRVLSVGDQGGGTQRYL